MLVEGQPNLVARHVLALNVNLCPTGTREVKKGILHAPKALEQTVDVNAIVLPGQKRPVLPLEKRGVDVEVNAAIAVVP